MTRFIWVHDARTTAAELWRELRRRGLTAFVILTTIEADQMFNPLHVKASAAAAAAAAAASEAAPATAEQRCQSSPLFVTSQLLWPSATTNFGDRRPQIEFL